MIFNRLGVGPLVALAAVLAATAPASAQDCKVKVADSLLVKPGTLVMSINPTLPPVQWVDDKGQLRGLHVELGDAIARKLCLKPEHVRVEFSVMVPGVQSGRWDMINTGMFFTEDRAKIMQLVRYGYDGISISAQAGNPLKITKPEDLAGRSVSDGRANCPRRWRRRASSPSRFGPSRISRRPIRRCARARSKPPSASTRSRACTERRETSPRRSPASTRRSSPSDCPRSSSPNMSPVRCRNSRPRAPTRRCSPPTAASSTRSLSTSKVPESLPRTASKPLTM